MHQNYIKYNTKTASKSTQDCSPLLCYRFVSTALTAQIPNGNAIANLLGLLHTGKERDSETGFSYFGARYYDSDLMTGWLSVDPMADKYPSLSPYAYCGWNPVRLVDPDGEDIYYFDKSGKYTHKERMKGEHIGVFLSTTNKQIKFSFADPINDPASIDASKINRIEIVSDKQIAKYLKDAGVYDKKECAIKDKYSYLLTESNASNKEGNGKLDFVVTAKPCGLNSSTLYLTKVSDELTAHNNYNFGNFLWGASTNVLGIPKFIATAAAHINNFFKDSNNATLPYYKRKLDSKNDQKSINLGIKWAKSQKK